MKFGVFGGTFDPPHIGHLIVAESARETLDLDHVRFVPAWIPPHKQRPDITSAHHRLRMLELAVSGNPNLTIDDREIQRQGVSYTVDTLESMLQHSPSDELYLLLGGDNLIEFNQWKDPERIAKLVILVVMTRPGFSVDQEELIKMEGVMVCEVPDIEIASREIRERIRDGKSVRYMLTDPVREYIDEHQLYRAL
ncbi:MAG: nicotinate-nucleotide adenylyltransferase [Bacteroidetes bacterium]|nr:nicotinate-nucleotide adenylyltransferase [Bacteroidota bacterium]